MAEQIRGNQYLWNRDFIIALLGYFCLFMSLTLFFIFPLFLEQFNPKKSQIGLIMGVHSLMAIFIRPLFGRLIDIRGRKGISLLGIGFLILILPCFHLVRNAGWLPLLLRALTGVGWGISMTATITLCSDMAPVERLAHSMGIIGVAGLSSHALGPLLAEEVVRQFGFGALFNASLAFLFFSFICILLTKETINPAQNRSQGYSWRNISLIIILAMSIMPAFHGAIRGVVVYFIALFGKSIALERVGPFFVAFSAAAIATRLLMGGISDRYGRKNIIIPAVCVVSLNLILISRVNSLWMFILTGLIGGFGQGLLFPALSTYIIDFLGKRNKGLALSLYLSLFDVGMGVGPPLFGRISDLYGYRKMYFFAGLVFLGVNLIFALKAPAVSTKNKA
ncbi:MAG: MFS transporter [Candidatus Aminicenantales bacterium]